MSVIGPRPGLWNQDILTAERDKYNANDVKEQESITFPEKPFDPGGRPATEKEEGVRYKQMHMKSAFDDGSQRIDPEAEICVSTDDIDTGKVTVVGIFKHGTPP